MANKWRSALLVSSLLVIAAVSTAATLPTEIGGDWQLVLVNGEAPRTAVAVRISTDVPGTVDITWDNGTKVMDWSYEIDAPEDRVAGVDGNQHMATATVTDDGALAVTIGRRLRTWALSSEDRLVVTTTVGSDGTGLTTVAEFAREVVE